MGGETTRPFLEEKFLSPSWLKIWEITPEAPRIMRFCLFLAKKISKFCLIIRGRPNSKWEQLSPFNPKKRPFRRCPKLGVSLRFLANRRVSLLTFYIFSGKKIDFEKIGVYHTDRK